MEELQGIYDNEIDFYLHQFQEVNKIDNLKTESQSVWNGCMMYIRRHVFPDNSKLKQKENYTETASQIPSTFNAYNYELVNSIVDYYIYLCTIYDKEISVIGFSNLTGIDNDTIYSWNNNSISNIYNNNNRVSSLSMVIYKKLIIGREESLSNKLATGNKNPVGILAILNRHYQWNLPGVSKEQSKQVLSASELPQLGGKSLAIPNTADTER